MSAANGEVVLTRRIPIHSSLLRPQLLGGAERELAIMNATLVAALIFGVGGVIGIGMGLVLGTTIHFMLTIAAKKDDKGMAVYRRQIHQQNFYAASAWVEARNQLNH